MLIAIFPDEDIQFSSIDMDKSDNIYVCQAESKDIYQISLDGNLTKLHENIAMCNKLYYDTIGQKFHFPCFDDQGTQYEVCYMRDVCTRKYKCHLYNYQTNKIKYDYMALLPRRYMNLKHFKYMKPADVKFLGSNVYFISRGGHVFYNDRFLMRLWTTLHDA